MMNKTKLLTEQFFLDLFPSIIYHDEDDYVFYRLVLEGNEFVHGLVDAYFAREKATCPYTIAEFKVEGAVTDPIIFLRIQIDNKSYAGIKSAYLLFQMGKEKKPLYKRYYIAVSGTGNDVFYRCIEDNGRFCICLGKVEEPDDENSFIAREYLEHYGLLLETTELVEE